MSDSGSLSLTLRTALLAALVVSPALSAQQPSQARKPPVKQPARPAAKEDPKPAEPSLLERAQKAFEAKDYQHASQLFSDYLKDNPEDASAWFNLAYSATVLGDSSAAEQGYKKALEVDAKLFQAHLNLALMLAEQDRHAEAIPHLKAAVELKPTHARAAALYAGALYRTGDRVRARQLYDEALSLQGALDVNAASTLGGSGRLAIDEKNYAMAIRQLARAVDLNPKDRPTQLELARAYELAEKPDRAAEVYRAVLGEYPSFAPAHRRLGIILFEQKKLDPAIEEFEAAARAEPNSEDDWNLARAYAAARKPDRALVHLLELRQRDPKNYEVLLLCGTMLNLKREFVAAQGALMQAVQLQPTIPDAYVELANAMYLQERYQETVAVLDRMKQAAEKVPETPWSAFLRAISLDKLRAAEGAIVSYRRFLAIAGGKYPDQEFQARQRVKALTIVLEKKGKTVPK